MKKQTLAPTQLFIGPKQEVEEIAQNYIQSFFCKNNYEVKSEEIKDCFCNECKKIKQHQHPFFIHICPSKDYILDDIQIIFEKTKFKLDNDQQFFFVLTQVEKLTPATANKLLKVLEEPAPGYNFILLTNNENNILPTIKSRCLIKQFGTQYQKNVINHPILSFFLDEQKLNDPFSFEQELKKHNLTNSQATDLIHQLLTFVLKKQLNSSSHRRARGSGQVQINWRKLADFLKNKLQKPPQTGSANIFLKNIFISLQHANKKIS